MGIKLLPLILIAQSCASVPVFQYRYYGFDVAHGVLLGPEIKDDLRPQEVCVATVQSVSPCIVLMNEEFFKLKQDYLEMQLRLIACGK